MITGRFLWKPPVRDRNGNGFGKKSKHPLCTFVEVDRILAASVGEILSNMGDIDVRITS